MYTLFDPVAAYAVWFTEVYPTESVYLLEVCSFMILSSNCKHILGNLCAVCSCGQLCVIVLSISFHICVLLTYHYSPPVKTGLLYFCLVSLLWGMFVIHVNCLTKVFCCICNYMSIFEMSEKYSSEMFRFALHHCRFE